jgi:hypothetical protein
MHVIPEASEDFPLPNLPILHLIQSLFHPLDSCQETPPSPSVVRFFQEQFLVFISLWHMTLCFVNSFYA